jgi:hypothetical protein
MTSDFKKSLVGHEQMKLPSRERRDQQNCRLRYYGDGPRYRKLCSEDSPDAINKFGSITAMAFLDSLYKAAALSQIPDRLEVYPTYCIYSELSR